MRKFRRAQAVNQASIERHLKKNIQESSSDEDNDGNNDSNEILKGAVNKTLSYYQYEGGDYERILSYLSELFQSGGAVCLICISTVKKLDPIWSCKTCFSFMHLTCIQHWIRDSLTYKNEKGINPLWDCPKCRTEYTELEVPAKYHCFCGQAVDPLYQPWSIPHSCGEPCNKYLQPTCGHRCLLLCHPGPCPPCPKMVQVSCYCGKKPPAPRRCNAKYWSCDSICDKLLDCAHKCQQKCHSESCPPCAQIISTSCNCGNKKSNLKCNDSLWKCDKPCERLFPCKIHRCNGVCHNSNDCGDCPRGKNRTCPCGKRKYEVSCTQPSVPTCGDTCGKMLNCKSHYCNQRCHPDNCGQCLEVVQKTCRCGSFTKELACAKDFHCNKKCTQMRQCARHPCNKKCCDCIATNTYNACEKICDITLNCRRHKCPAPCHSGPCYPCPRMVVIQCRCGGSKITVPCGTRRVKPPKCTRMCKIPPDCHHPKRESHKCHQGTCPPCKKICGLIYKRCGHDCKAACHTNAWTKVLVNGVHQPSGPWETPYEKMQLQTLPCPPCKVSVRVTCLGGHETSPWPCYQAIPTSCQRLCGQILPCSNHTCEKICHKLKLRDDDDEKPPKSKKSSIATDCKPCELTCVLPRPAGCSHTCPMACHPAPCQPCRQIVKLSCHCGINSLYKRCCEITGVPSDQKIELLQCGNQCPRTYPCGHRCVDACHAGTCRGADACNKKVKITCKCTRMKKSFPCIDVRMNCAYVACDEDCKALMQAKERQMQLEAAKKLKEEEMRNQREIEKFERKFNKPRRKIKERINSDDTPDNSKLKIIFVIFVGVALSILSYFAFYFVNTV